MKGLAKLRTLLYRLTHAKLDSTGFANTLDELSIEIVPVVKEMITESMIDLWEEIVDDTPVDLGVAAGNWQIKSHYNSEVLHQDILDKKASGEINSLTKTRLVPKPERPSINSLKNSSNILIFNNVDYIDELEHGSSPQARSGEMVADNVEKYKKVIERNLKNTGVFK